MIVKKLVIYSLLLVFTHLSSAQTAAPELGRLFSNSNERQILNRMRADNRVQESDSIPVLSVVSQGLVESDMKTDRKPPPILINGLVKKGNNQSVVWINGERIDGSSGPGDVRIYSSSGRDNNVVVGVMNRRAVVLKPGQRLKSADGSVEEGYESGENPTDIMVKP